MKNKKILTILFTVLVVVALLTALSVTSFAAEAPAETVESAEAETANSDTISAKAISVAVIIAVVGGIGAIGMAIAIGKCAEGMARQPEAAGKINSAMMLGLVFIETVVIYALIVSILVIFVL